MHEIIISEKPKAAEKIAKALSPKVQQKKVGKVKYWEFEEDGKTTTVVSAVGHLYGLAALDRYAKYKFNIDWFPAYEINKSNAYVRDYITAIKKLSKGADKFVHACDYDIEGTLIGYHALQYACGNNAEVKATRMKFSTLTKTDIKNAYDNMIDIDYHQVDSGIARHFLDYYYGINISAALGRAVRVAKGRRISLSAGRVQTPALSMLVDREKEIKAFVPEPYWMIKAKSDHDIIADHTDGKIFDKEHAEAIFKNCQGADATVTDVNVSETIRKPPIPFNLGGLQAEAHNAFGFSPKRTQVAAQNLYTGGYTSYPRTSSQKLPESLNLKNILLSLSKDAEFKKHITKLPKNLKPNEGKKEDAAHPAIHPTGVLPGKLDADEKKIYELIVYRFISCFGEDSKLETMKTNLNVGAEEFEFKRKRVSYMGWLEHYKKFRKVEAEEFPPIKEGDTLKIHEILSEEKETKPPARYNEASLIKELEKRELGTKATRADIIAKLYDRKYITGKKKIEVNKLGEDIIDTLKEYCSNITSEELTRDLEKDIEAISQNKISKDEIIKKGEEEVRVILADIEKNETAIGTKIYVSSEEADVIGDCACGGKLVKRTSRKNKTHFVGCSKFPECRTLYPLPKGANILKKKCPDCGLPMISYGKPRQQSCLDPNCGKQVSRRQAPEVVGKCPECGRDLLKRSGRYGEFVGCSGFPNCKFTTSMDKLSELNKKEKEIPDKN